ncbi:MAG: efflux RND transporter periplasmic adaptor subunit [bacterium]|nr:efflux RND transporter periplasmic adaptor subunit [bacterium]
MNKLILSLFLVFAALATAVLAYNRSWWSVGDGGADVTSTYTVQRRNLEDRVVERGEVESQKTVYGKCEIPGRSKITFIVPEGTEVKEGDRVAEFETNEIDQEIQQKEIALNEAKGKLDEAVQAVQLKSNENDTNIAAAQLAFDIAKIELEKFEKGDFISESSDMLRAIKEAEAALEKVRDEKSNMEILVKKGYRTPQQLLEVQLREQTYEFAVERDKRKYEVLVTYDREKRLIEFRGKLSEAELKLDRAKKTAEAEMLKAQAAVENAKNGVTILEQQLEEYRKLREKCTLYAEQDGTVAYANERWYDASERIREGTELYSGRSVYFLPDMSRMQVKANIHESVVDRVQVGQKASIRLDAFSDVRLSGTVSKVAGMAASTYSSVQNYETIVLIDELPYGLAIKPGMTAAVDILVGTYRDVLAVPVGAITEHFEQSYVYVLNAGKGERRKVTTGRSTHSFVEILDGLQEGDVVALDAYQRGLEDFADAERDAERSLGVPEAEANAT